MDSATSGGLGERANASEAGASTLTSIWRHPLAEMYVGGDPGSPRQLLLTFLRPGIAASEAGMKACLATCHILRKQRSAFIYGIAQGRRIADGRLVLAGDMLTGAPLSEQIAAGRFSPARAIPILRQICHALEVGHSMGMPHGALSTASVLLEVREGKNDAVRVTDFGLADEITADRLGDHEVDLQPLCPELFDDESPEPERDIYLTGAIAYAMLAGRPMFEGTPDTIREAHALREPEPLEVDARLSRVVMRCLAKDPSERFSSVRELERALLAAQTELQIQTPWDALHGAGESGTWGGAAALDDPPLGPEIAGPQIPSGPYEIVGGPTHPRTRTPPIEQPQTRIGAAAVPSKRRPTAGPQQQAAAASPAARSRRTPPPLPQSARATPPAPAPRPRPAPPMSPGLYSRVAVSVDAKTTTHPTVPPQLGSRTSVPRRSSSTTAPTRELPAVTTRDKDRSKRVANGHAGEIAVTVPVAVLPTPARSAPRAPKPTLEAPTPRKSPSPSGLQPYNDSDEDLDTVIRMTGGPVTVAALPPTRPTATRRDTTTVTPSPVASPTTSPPTSLTAALTDPFAAQTEVSPVADVGRLADFSANTQVSDFRPLGPDLEPRLDTVPAAGRRIWPWAGAAAIAAVTAAGWWALSGDAPGVSSGARVAGATPPAPQSPADSLPHNLEAAVPPTETPADAAATSPEPNSVEGASAPELDPGSTPPSPDVRDGNGSREGAGSSTPTPPAMPGPATPAPLSKPRTKPRTKPRPKPRTKPRPKSKPASPPPTGRSRALYNEGKQAFASGNTNTAKKLLKESLALDGGQHGAAALLAKIYFNAGDYNTASKYLRKAILQAPSKGAYRIALGDALFKRGSMTEAKMQYAKARKLGHPKADSRIEKVNKSTG